MHDMHACPRVVLPYTCTLEYTRVALYLYLLLRCHAVLIAQLHMPMDDGDVNKTKVLEYVHGCRSSEYLLQNESRYL